MWKCQRCRTYQRRRKYQKCQTHLQADREPTKLPSLSQPTLAQSKGKAPEPLPAAQDRRVKTDGDLRKLLIRRPKGTRDATFTPGSDGWMNLAQYAEQYTKPDVEFGDLVSKEFRRGAFFAVVGAATAYGITGMKRTDVPGLATASDGRWDYPVLVKPPLPSGSLGPFAEDNKAGAHYADLRALVLPEPKGARDDKALRGTDGWLATDRFLAEYADTVDRETLGQKLTDRGLRHIAARGWTMPDGTHTRIYLLQFDTAAVADDLYSSDLVTYNSTAYQLRGTDTAVPDESFPTQSLVEKVPREAYTESKPYGTEQVRQAYLSAGDSLALIVQSRKGSAKAVPFQQTVVLQSQLLD